MNYNNLIKLIEKIEKKEKNEDQMKWYIKLISKGLTTENKFLKETIIRGLYNLEFQL
jgi:hypothetical protein